MWEASSFKRSFVQQLRSLDVKLLILTLVPLLAATAVAEAAMFLGNEVTALSIYVLVLLYCLFLPLQVPSATGLLVSFGLLPVFRLVSTVMPAVVDGRPAMFTLVYLPFLLATVVVIRGHDEVLIHTSQSALLRWSVPALVLASGMAVGEFLILDPDPFVSVLSPAMVLAAVAVLTLAALVEEMLFRGILQTRLNQHLGSILGIALTSVLFGAMYSVYGSGLAVAFGTSVGVVYGAVYEWTDSLGLVVLMHGVLNSLAFGVLPHTAL